MKVLSLGAGVQSTALLMMADAGALGDKPDCAIFADTQWEPRAVYEHLEYIEANCSIPIHRVSAGNIREDALSDNRFASMPLYVKRPDGSTSLLARQCTSQYKIQPIYRKMRELLGGSVHNGAVELWMGISLDEAQRMKPARVKWVTNRWPLIEQRMSRHDCKLWLKRNGYPEPPKSACIGCPYHTREDWRKLKNEHPDDFADAVDFDNRIKGLAQIDGEAYLHRGLKALAETDFRNEQDAGQLTLDDECEGMCGL